MHDRNRDLRIDRDFVIARLATDADVPHFVQIERLKHIVVDADFDRVP
jgi:hypothetical protein